ncbi:hypothetical protein ACHAXT_012154 [Thalassiosira profunda]
MVAEENRAADDHAEEGAPGPALATYAEGIFSLLTFDAATSDDEGEGSIHEGAGRRIEEETEGVAAVPVQDPPPIQPTPSPPKEEDTDTDSDSDSEEAICKRRVCYCNRKIIFLGACLLGVALGAALAISYLINPSLYKSAASSTESHGRPNGGAEEPASAQPTATLSDESFAKPNATVEEVSPLPTTLTATSSNETYITFYVMADTPYTDHERNVVMPTDLANLDNDAAFLVHLGDLQDAKVDECREGAYIVASDILKQSALPVFPLPGDNDINDCESLEHGHLMWKKYFARMDEDELWDHQFQVLRWGQVDESFAFLHNGILFLGLNIIGGSPRDLKEWWIRHATHLRLVKELMTTHREEFDAVVLFAHASPGEYHEDFFGGRDGLAQFVKRLGKPFLHLHGDDHYWYEQENAFDVRNYMMISLDPGEDAPPIKVTVDTSAANPIKILRGGNREVQCCQDGWWQVEKDLDDDRYEG